VFNRLVTMTKESCQCLCAFFVRHFDRLDLGGWTYDSNGVGDFMGVNLGLG
jgi:hypothetical protein